MYGCSALTTILIFIKLTHWLHISSFVHYLKSKDWLKQFPEEDERARYVLHHVISHNNTPLKLKLQIKDVTEIAG